MTAVQPAARSAAAQLAGRARRHPVPFAVTGGVIALEAVYSAGMAICPQMSMTRCLTAAVLVVAGASTAAITARAAWLAGAAARAVAALSHAAPPAALAGAASRAGIGRIRCLAGTGAAAFCAGLLMPAVYVTAGAAAALPPAELDAVLAHEAAHARRRDPLRRLVARAAADTLFYLPLARWWSRRQAETAELRADRSAVGYAGRRAVAGALLTVAESGGPAGAAAYGGATGARVAQLLGDELPARRPAAALVIISAAGLIAAVWLAMCVGQAALGWAGLP
ncbi:MAG: M56 family metallopeptidase [Actinomycetota bacterium]|nr:M56 family metallopeptidase [Actinomycetota bacterium]